jgi:uncharacterized protein YjlB
MQRNDVEHMYIEDDGKFPNNSRIPLLVYRSAVDVSDGNGAGAFETIFQQNQWEGSWRNGVYGVHHYHSTAHEVLGVYSGFARVQFGGESGSVCEVFAGDVVVIPAGVSHKRVSSSGDFRVVGAYPRGQRWDMNYGNEGERPQTDKNIAGVPNPGADPVYGEKGPLKELW